MKRSTTTTLGGVVLAILLAVLGAAPALGSTEPRRDFTLEKGESFEQSYPPIEMMSPSLFRPSLDGCRQEDACEVVDVSLVTDSAFGNRLTVALDWDVTAENDLDLYIWNAEGREVGSSATAGHPEETSLVDMPAGDYHVGVLNWAGVNTGYTLAGSFEHEEINIFRGEEPRAAAQDTDEKEVQPRTEPQVAEPAPAEATTVQPTVEPEQFDVPGADGPQGEVEFGTLAAASQAQPLEDGTAIATIVLAVLAALVAIGGGTVVALKIRRETATR